MGKKMAALRPLPPAPPFLSFLSFLSFLPYRAFRAFLPFRLTPNPYPLTPRLARYASKSATLTDPIVSSPCGGLTANPCA